MSDLRITEAFLYMDYLVGAGRGRRAASRISRWPMAPRLERQPRGFLSLGWDARGGFLPGCPRGAASGEAGLTGRGAAGTGGHGGTAGDGATLRAPLRSPGAGLSFRGSPEFSALRSAELQVLLKSHKQNGSLSAPQVRSFGCY